MKILLLDNYDSFTYNLVHYLEGADAHVTVWRNDEVNFSNLQAFDKIVLSPGPGLPKESGQLMQVIEAVVQTKPVLGVCLGFQALVEFHGGHLINQSLVKHGVSVACVRKNNSTLLNKLPEKFKVGLYHSWAADPMSFPEQLNITAMSEENVIMAFEHVQLPVYGVQFHPESLLTQHGHTIIRNFVTS